MLNTPYIADLIERGKIDEIKGAMEKAMIRGCQTFDNALYELWRTGKASEAEVLKHADSRNNLALKIRMDNMGRRHKMPPIKKEITFDETAPFADYRTFRISPIKVESHRPNSEQRTTTAVLERVPEPAQRSGRQDRVGVEEQEMSRGAGRGSVIATAGKPEVLVTADQRRIPRHA